jgi:hypothetical protein
MRTASSSARTAGSLPMLDYSHPRSPNAERSAPGGAYHPAGKTPRALAARLNRDLYSSLDVALCPQAGRTARTIQISKTAPMKPEIR